MAAQHTPGPWREGQSGSIVADQPSGWDDPESVKFYGGHMVCESVQEYNRPLIIAATDLLAACEATEAFEVHLEECRVCDGADAALCETGVAAMRKAFRLSAFAAAKAKGGG